MNFANYCRICLNIDDKHVNVLENEDINKKIESCLSSIVTQEDNFPKGVCTACINMLCQFCDFQLKAKTSEQFFTNILYSKCDETYDRTSSSTGSISNNENLSPLYNENTTDSLLEFLTKNGDIDPQHNHNIGERDVISPFVSYLEESGTSLGIANKLIQGGVKVTKITSMKNENMVSSPNQGYEIHMEIDVLDSDEDIVREILLKESANTRDFQLKYDESLSASNSNVNTNKYSCLTCKKMFHNISILTTHMQVCKRTCLDCDLLFETQHKLKQHRLFHRPELDQVCQQCGKTCSDKKSLLQHIQTSHADFVSELGCVYRCRQCGELFEDRKDLYFHAKKHIQNKDKNKKIQCCDCGEIFTNKTLLDSHTKNKQCSGISPSDVPCVYRCKVCMTLFTDRRKLYLHVKKHCDQGPQLCDHCGKSYSNSATLNRHVLTHVGKKFQCQNCERNFADNALLEKHLLLHARTDSFICEMCGITFKKQDTLFFHIVEKHNSESIAN